MTSTMAFKLIHFLSSLQQWWCCVAILDQHLPFSAACSSHQCLIIAFHICLSSSGSCSSGTSSRSMQGQSCQGTQMTTSFELSMPYFFFPSYICENDPGNRRTFILETVSIISRHGLFIMHSIQSVLECHSFSLSRCPIGPKSKQFE